MDECSFTFFVGVDWGASHHQVCILPADSEKAQQHRVRHEPQALRTLFDLLHQLGPADSIAIAIESPASPVTESLVEAGWTVFSINPKQLDRCRDRFSPAGAKDDRRDAHVLAHCLRSDAACFRRLAPVAPWQLDLRSLTRQRAALQADRRVQANRLREDLLTSFPQLLGLVAGADEPWLWDLLRIAPTPAHAARLGLPRLAGLLRRHRIRRLTAEQLQSALRSGCLPLPRASFERHGLAISCLVGVLAALDRALGDTERALARVLEQRIESENQGGQPRDLNIILSLPGVGTHVAATLLAEAHEALQRRDYHALRAHAGVAPVTRSSGKSCLHLMRRSCNRRLRDALYHWGRCSCQNDQRSRARYALLRARGHSHGRALRGVADRLLQLLCSMLRNQTAFDPARSAPSPAPRAA